MTTNKPPMPTGGFQITSYSVETGKVIKRFDSYVYMCDAMEDHKAWFVNKYGWKPDWMIDPENRLLYCHTERLTYYLERVWP